MDFIMNLFKRGKFKKRGKNVFIGKNCKFYKKNSMEIGDNVYIGPNGKFFSFGGIVIGSGTVISYDVEIQTRNHNYDSTDLKSIPYDEIYISKSVNIGENVWIGSGVKIVPGVCIGEGAIVGMGSVVSKDVPSFCVVGGNPAKVLKKRNIEKYLQLKKEGKIYLSMKNSRRRW